MKNEAIRIRNRESDYNLPMRAGTLLLLLGGCSYTLENDLSEARAQIRSLQAQIPPASPLWISEGPDRFDAFTEDGSASVPRHIHEHVLWKLSELSPAAAELLVQGAFDYEACRKDPGVFRGKFWRVNGLIGDLRPGPVEHPRHPVAGAHSGALFDEARRAVLFHVAEKPDVLTLHEDTVMLGAVFVQWVDYTSKSGRVVSAPYFIGKLLRRTL